MLMLRWWVPVPHVFKGPRIISPAATWRDFGTPRAARTVLAARGAAPRGRALRRRGGGEADAGKSRTTCFRGNQRAPRTGSSERKSKSESTRRQAVRSRGIGAFPPLPRPALPAHSRSPPSPPPRSAHARLLGGWGPWGLPESGG